LVGVAVNVTLVPEQIVDPALLLMLTDEIVVGFTVIVMPLLFTEAFFTQVIDEVSTQRTTSLLPRAEEL
jgi:hypothetical protein